MIKRQEEHNKDINEKLVLNFMNNKQNDCINQTKKEDINNDKKINNVKKTKFKYTQLVFDEENFERYCVYRNKIMQYINCSKIIY